jgi:hypothetical protein
MENPEFDHWMWDTGGTVPGGAVSRTNASGIGQVLSTGLWTVLEVATAKSVPIVLLNFPRFARDFDYLWAQLGSHLPEHINRDVLHDAWKSAVQPKLVREFESNDKGPSIDEMRGMVADLARQISSLKHQNSESTLSVDQRSEHVRELERMLAETNVALAETKAELAATQHDLEQAKTSADANTSLAEFMVHNDQRISEINQRLEHLRVVVERSSQPFARKLARFIRNWFTRRT